MIVPFDRRSRKLETDWETFGKNFVRKAAGKRVSRNGARVFGNYTYFERFQFAVYPNVGVLHIFQKYSPPYRRRPLKVVNALSYQFTLRTFIERWQENCIFLKENVTDHPTLRREKLTIITVSCTNFTASRVYISNNTFESSWKRPISFRRCFCP